MSVCGEEQTPNNEREQVRSQKSAMGRSQKAAGGQWGSGGEAPSRWRFRGKAPSRRRHRGYGAEPPALENFAFFCKNNSILGLF